MSTSREWNEAGKELKKLAGFAAGIASVKELDPTAQTENAEVNLLYHVDRVRARLHLITAQKGIPMARKDGQGKFPH